MPYINLLSWLSSNNGKRDDAENLRLLFFIITSHIIGMDSE